ncbi:MAG: hypothetical protein HUJ68_13140 [Clostridia bacterium]|nr:hypothetical protein [Clostridia bacterium]
MFKKLFLSKNKPHAIIFVETKFSNPKRIIKDYLKSLVCSQTPFCNKCEQCKKIDNNAYFDYIEFDGYQSNIRKEDIVFIRNQFAKSASEVAGKKFFVLYGVENSSKEAMNGLLKFIEEPLENTYAILTTKNISKVLTTIKSRCQIYHIKTNIKDFEKELESFNMSLPDTKIALNCYNNIECFKVDFFSGKFRENVDFVLSLIKSVNEFNTIKSLSAQFKSFD